MSEQYVGDCAWGTIDRHVHVYREETEFRGV